MENGKVSLADIHRLQDFNVRSMDSVAASDESIEELALDIRKNGQMTPLIVRVRAKGGGYDLLAGYRRYAALKKIEFWNGEDSKKAKTEGKKDPNHPPVTAEIRVMASTGDAVKDEEEAAFINARENIHREDVGPYDWGMKFAQLKSAFGLTANQIGSRIGSGKFSKSTVNNYMNIIASAHATVLDAWKKGAPTDKVLKVISLPKAEQVDAFNAVMGLTKDGEKGGDEGDNEGGEGGDKPEAKRGASRKKIEAALKVINKKSTADAHGEDWQKGARAALRYVLGESEKLGDVWPLPEEKDEEKAA